MIPLNISIDSSVEATIVSNRFIDDYMKDANDAQIKIYLYLLRMTASKLPTDLSEIADKFNLTEKDLGRALTYWEKKGLLSISYNEEKNITGIVIHDLNKVNNKINQVAEAPVITNVSNIAKDVVKEDNHIQITLDQVIPMIKMDYEAEKNNYSLDNIKALKKDPEFAMLINIGSQYLSHPLSPVEIKSLAFIYDRLGFSMDLTDHLIDFVVDNGNKSMHYIEQTAIDWYENGVTTVAAAKKHAKKFNKHTYEIMGFLGKKGNVTSKELSFINKWTIEYGFSLDIIEEACTRTVMRTDTNRFAYANTILADWYTKKVHTKEDISRLDDLFELSKKPVSENPVNNSTNKAMTEIQQYDYDFDELEKLLISNQ